MSTEIGIRLLAAVVIAAVVLVVVIRQVLRQAGASPGRAQSSPAPTPRAPRTPLEPGTRHLVQRLLDAGEKIRAIKTLREAVPGLSLAAAKRRVDDWHLEPHAAEPPAPVVDDELAASARAVRDTSGPNAAIKHVRERTRWGLAEAKAYVDRLV